MKKNIVITAGGTSEYIDKVRKITNSGTGKLGAMIANVLSNRNDIDTIYYITTPKSIRPQIGINKIYGKVKLEIIEIIDTMQLKDVVENILKNNKIDWFIHSMAVSDYMVDYVSTIEMVSKELKDSDNIEYTLKNATNILDKSKKISSSEDNLLIVLKQTPKIINIIKKISPNTSLIGFKLLNNVSKEYLLEIGMKLLQKNNCEYVVANDLEDIKNGNHKAYILNKQAKYEEINGKENIAKYISKII